MTTEKRLTEAELRDASTSQPALQQELDYLETDLRITKGNADPIYHLIDLLASNTNAREETLIQAFPHVPATVIANPSMDLVILKNPQLPNTLFGNIMGSSSPPPWHQNEPGENSLLEALQRADIPSNWPIALIEAAHGRKKHYGWYTNVLAAAMKHPATANATHPRPNWDEAYGACIVDGFCVSDLEEDVTPEHLHHLFSQPGYAQGIRDILAHHTRANIDAKEKEEKRKKLQDRDTLHGARIHAIAALSIESHRKTPIAGGYDFVDPQDPNFDPLMYEIMAKLEYEAQIDAILQHHPEHRRDSSSHILKQAFNADVDCAMVLALRFTHARDTDYLPNLKAIADLVPILQRDRLVQLLMAYAEKGPLESPDWNYFRDLCQHTEDETLMVLGKRAVFTTELTRFQKAISSQDCKQLGTGKLRPSQDYSRVNLDSDQLEYELEWFDGISSNTWTIQRSHLGTIILFLESVTPITKFEAIPYFLDGIGRRIEAKAPEDVEVDAE